MLESAVFCTISKFHAILLETVVTLTVQKSPPFESESKLRFLTFPMLSIVAVSAIGRHTLAVSQALESRHTGMRLAEFRRI